MEFKLSREEEMIFREVQALAGDLQQIAENLLRHHEQRLKHGLKHAEEVRKRQAEQPGIELGKIGALPVMVLNRQSLNQDLDFVLDRLTLLIRYIQEPGEVTR